MDINGIEVNLYDVIIIGAGPGGMTAGIYSGRANLKVLVIEKGIPGGQMANTEEIENYPSFKKVLGPELSKDMFEHMKSCGVEYKYGDVKEIRKFKMNHKNIFKIDLGNKIEYSKTVILGMGTNHLKLGVEGEQELAGRGVSYCAVCDGAFFKEKDLAVVGGGDSAVEEAIYLTRFASSVTLFVRGDKLRAQPVLVDRLLKNDKISIRYNTVIEEIHGEGEGFSKKVVGVRINNKIKEDNSQCQELYKNVDGVFIYIGMKPNSDIVKGLVELDEAGYIITNNKMETSIEGIYAIGDIRNTPLRQIISACGDGSIAGQEVYNYIENNF